MVLLHEQKIDEAPHANICPENDLYSEQYEEVSFPCDIDGPFTIHNNEIDFFDGTDKNSGYMGIPYPIIF